MAVSQVPSFANLAHELTFTLEWYLHNVQPYTHVVLAITAKKLTVAPKWGLACCKMVRLD